MLVQCGFVWLRISAYGLDDVCDELIGTSTDYECSVLDKANIA